MPKRMIDTDLWNDTKFADEFTPEDKYFWLFLLTTRYGNISGCFEISPKQIAKDIGYSEESVLNLIERFIRYELIDYNKAHKELIILNWYRYNWSSSPLVEKSIEKELDKIKTENYKEYIIDTFSKLREGNTLSIGYRYPTNTISNNSLNYISIKDKEKEKENNVKEKQKERRFKRPDISEVEQYVLENYETNHKLFAEKFHAYYESNGWKVGKNPMKDWKATIRTWVAKENISKKKAKEKVVDETVDDNLLERLRGYGNKNY